MSDAARALVMLAAVLTAPAAPPDEPPRPQLLLEQARGWWVLDDGQTLIVQTAGKLQKLDPGTGTLKPLAPAPKPLRQVYRIDPSTLGYETHGEDFTIVNTATGKVTSCVTGRGNYEPFGMRKGRDWFVVMAIRMDEKPNFEFHRVDLKTHKVAHVYDTGDEHGVTYVVVPDKGNRLVVWTASGHHDALLRRTVQLDTGKVVKDLVPQGDELYPLPDGSGHVVQQQGKLHLLRDGKQTPLFEGKYRARVELDSAIRPRRLGVSLLTDTNRDGKLARVEGDRIEIWLLDLRTLKKTRLADASEENLLARWSKDGRLLAFKRWEKSPETGRPVSTLLVHDPDKGRTHRLLPGPGSLSIRRIAFLGGPWLLAKEMSLAGKDLFKGRPFLVNFRRGKPRVLAPKPEAAGAVVGGWLILSDYDVDGRTYRLHRWRIPSGS